MTKRYVTRFIVEGRYNFPFDMLRYDQAWPTGFGPSALQSLFHNPGAREQVKVELMTHTQITPDRWASFGWYVLPETVVKSVL